MISRVLLRRCVLYRCAAIAAPLHRSYVLWNHFLPKEGPFAFCSPPYSVLDIWTASTAHCQIIKWTGNRKEKEEVEENSLFTGGILTHDLLNTRRGLYRCQNTWSINFFYPFWTYWPCIVPGSTARHPFFFFYITKLEMHLLEEPD